MNKGIKNKKGPGNSGPFLYLKRALARAGALKGPRRALFWAAAAAAASVLIFGLLSVIFPLPLYKLERDYSVLHLASDGSLLRISLSPSGRYRIKMPSDALSGFVKKGIVEYEDKWFYFHPGINPFSVVRAAFLNIKSGRVVSGASTITMQLARMIEPRNRKLGSKIIEAFRALQLEARYSKKEILEMYLNTIPMGGNIEGVAAASYIYFNKAPSEITAGGAALLIALPKSPEKNRPDRNPSGAAAARNEVINRVGRELGIAGGLEGLAVNEPVTGKRFANPYDMPHLVNKNLPGAGFVRRYNAETGIQKRIEYMLAKASAELKPYGVHNGAAIVVRNKDRAVIAYAGSPDFGDKEHCGEINGAAILRSPGSALKPLIYALGADSGIITPRRIVYDIKREYAVYRPVNYGKKFNGPVTAEFALASSLNIPAVHLEYTLGTEAGLLSLLDRAGLVGYRRKGLNPGLSAALGAFPVTLEELAMIYAGTADGGFLKPLNFLKESAEGGRGIRMFSEQAAYMITSMLASADRPDLPQSWEFTKSRGKVAFKTGTSFGLRDAWCAGYDPEYTVAVWFGNADATGSFELIGAKAAAPFVIEVFNSLTRYNDRWFQAPIGVSSREVCALSGMVPGAHCGRVYKDMYIEGVSSWEKCQIHTEIFVRKDSGKRADPASMKDKPEAYKKIKVENWPPEAAAFMRKGGKHLSKIPPYAEGEGPQGPGMKPVILSPADGCVYVVAAKDESRGVLIEFSAAVEGGNEKIYWFLNGKATATAKADSPVFLSLKPGLWEVAVQDGRGGNAPVVIRVEPER